MIFYHSNWETLRESACSGSLWHFLICRARWTDRLRAEEISCKGHGCWLNAFMCVVCMLSVHFLSFSVKDHISIRGQYPCFLNVIVPFLTFCCILLHLSLLISAWTRPNTRLRHHLIPLHAILTLCQLQYQSPSPPIYTHMPTQRHSYNNLPSPWNSFCFCRSLEMNTVHILTSSVFVHQYVYFLPLFCLLKTHNKSDILPLSI